MHGRWRATATAVAASGLAIGLMAAGMEAAAQTPEREAPQRQAHRVTLITGDRVSLFAGPEGTWRTSVEPADRRRDVVFRTLRTGDELYVIPSDVAALVAKGTLDRRLFDVAGLAADGYDDQDAKAIPLIVTYRGKAGRSAVESSGADQTRNLPAINGAAVQVDKPDAAAFVESVTGSSAARLAAGIEKVWLDGKRKQLLEQSVPQIGAPFAWEAGYTGKGVKVAVLDGGVEATHPDLTGQVVESKNFSDSPDGDPDGHGTHVAGTVAGTGDASDGRRKGVAPDAAILDGKVCEDGGWCQESAILAGMQWAATEKDADIVNLSLGDTDTPEIDPLEEAVNTLTEQTGALFVVSSGNDGPGNGTIDTPGSAEAALTVGAVDKSDELAGFSSRGPRVGDGGIKPDLTAPGVDIVAAKSERAGLGEPVDDRYLRLSGTSMAAPHVAGVAALLAQQHPDWEATELKAALMGSAKTHPDQSVFEQGAGRVDAAAAIKQSVFATTPSLSFGTTTWPHGDDAPITKTVTFRNTGDAAVTLSLAANLTGPDGEPAPGSAISVSATELTIPAGGLANVTVTADTSHNGPDGTYTGQVTATSTDGANVAVPAAVTREAESYDLTLRHVGPDGVLTGAGLTSLWGLDDELRADLWDADGEVTIRLPTGRYHLDSTFDFEDEQRVDQIIQPVLTLDKDTTIDADARTTKPVRHTVPDRNAVRDLLDLTNEFIVSGGSVSVGIWVFGADTKAFTRSVGEGRPDDDFVGSVSSHWKSEAAEDEPTSYVMFDYEAGSAMTGNLLSPSQAEFATVVSELHAPGAKTAGAKGFYPIAPGGGTTSASMFGHELPATVTQHLYGPPGARWWSELTVTDLVGEDWATDATSAPATYQAGKTYRDRWNAAALGLSANGMNAERAGNKLEFVTSPLVDSVGHVAWYFRPTEVATRLFRNDKLLAETDWVDVTAEDVPAERGDFRLETSVVRDPAVSGPISTRVDSVWTFDSAAPGGSEADVLPLWSVRYRPKVDGSNAMTRRPVTRLPIQVESELGKDAAKLGKVTVDVSGDGGKTWRKTKVLRTGNDRYLAVFATPQGESVSLRANVADKEGNTAKQTILAAYLLR